jgi:hypothetical protein
MTPPKTLEEIRDEAAEAWCMKNEGHMSFESEPAFKAGFDKAVEVMRDACSICGSFEHKGTYQCPVAKERLQVEYPPKGPNFAQFADKDQQLKDYEQALKFYADPFTWSRVWADAEQIPIGNGGLNRMYGDNAREALKRWGK